MTQNPGGAPKLSAQDKAERTTQAAASIMSAERKASDAKVARLKALRLASEQETAVVEAKANTPAAARSTKRVTASTIRKLALQPDSARTTRKIS